MEESLPVYIEKKLLTRLSHGFSPEKGDELMKFSAPVSEEAKKLHYDSIVIDGTTFFCKGYGDHFAQAGVTALNITVPDPDDDIDGAVEKIASYYQLIKEDPKLQLIETVDDIFRTKEEGDVGIILAFQNARPMAYNLAMAEVFHRLGTRVVILAYNRRNFASDWSGTDDDTGLSQQGRELIQEMNRLGIVLDLTHLSDRSSLEAIEISKKPPIFSHSNPRSRVNLARNITDDQIKKVAAKGGVVGLTVFAPLNWKGGNVLPTLGDYLDNMEYVIDMAGIDHVSIGTDSEATPGAYPPELRSRLRTQFSHLVGGYYQTFKDNPEANHLDGFSGMADFPLITQGLLDRGYDEASIRKILGLNLVRVFQEVWQ
jgi:membrane dipeptidase